MAKYEDVRNYIIPDGLYNDQRKALDALYDWYHSDELECTLEGFAGTGKTFVLKAFINNIVNKAYTVTAPTHKALKVLESHVNVKGRTLHNLHGLRPNLDLKDFNIERPQFDPKGSANIRNYNLIIIDEASMINTSLFLLNRNRANEFKVKILYVGDPYQLPPVGEKISPVFKIVTNKIILNEIVRQNKNNPLLELFELIRYDIDNGTSHMIDHIINNKDKVIGGNGYQLDLISNFKNRIVSVFKSDKFSKNTNIIRVATYTNRTVSTWNQYVRNELNTSNDILHINDLLTAYSTIVDEFNTAILLNSEDYFIEAMRPYVTDIGLKVFIVNLRSLSTDVVTPPFFILDHRDPNTFSTFKNVMSAMHTSAKQGASGGWFKYYKFKNKYLTMIDIKLDYCDVTVKKDIDYGYSITTHKLQGTTLDNIAIDLTDIVNGFRNDRDSIIYRNKLIYVALSRAKHFALLKF